jgi:hypothetical protein
MDQVLGTRLNFPDPNNLMSFELYITPTDGLYKGAEYRFTITIPSTYPYDPPKAQCETPVSASFTLFTLLNINTLLLSLVYYDCFII